MVFTIPVLIFFGERGQEYFRYFQITCSLAGGILGVLMMLPLRCALIVNEQECCRTQKVLHAPRCW